MERGINKMIKKFAGKEIDNNVNSLCIFLYQPKLPAGCEKFKKSMK